MELVQNRAVNYPTNMRHSDLLFHFYDKESQINSRKRLVWTEKISKS